MSASASPRVLITADTLGGVWTYALELASALGQRGVQVALATMGARLTAHQRAQLDALPKLTVFESGYKLEWMQGAWDDVQRAGEWLLRIERDWRPDLVHLNQFAFGALTFRAPTLVVAHSCVLSWWRAVRGEPAPPQWDTYRRRVAQGLRGAGLVVAPTRAMLHTLVRDYGYAQAAQVIGNGRDSARFSPARKEPSIVAAGRDWRQHPPCNPVRRSSSERPGSKSTRRSTSDARCCSPRASEPNTRT